MTEDCWQFNSGHLTLENIFVFSTKNKLYMWPVLRRQSQLIYLADAYEYYYGEHREEGQDLVREYCEIKTHLRVKIEHPKPDPEVEAQQTPLAKVSIPSVFLSGE